MCPSATLMFTCQRTLGDSALWQWSPSHSRQSSQTSLSLGLWYVREFMIQPPNPPPSSFKCLCIKDLTFLMIQAKFSATPELGFVPLGDSNFSYYIAVPTSLRVDPDYCKVKLSLFKTSVPWD